MKQKLLSFLSTVQRITTRENLQIKAIKSLGLTRPLWLLDVGSAKGMQNRWKVVKDMIFAYGFEPDEGARQKLEQNAVFLGGGNVDSPFALSDKVEKLELNILKKPSHSSVLEPNNKFINLFPLRHPEGFELDYKLTVDACNLDYLDIDEKDFMKIDVQGYELKVLRGAESSLRELLGLEIEIDFGELYKNQCSFGEINEYLTHHNYTFIDFTSLTRWERNSAKNTIGQCIGGDALFLKTPEYIHSKYDVNSEKLAVYLSICLIYKRYDLISTSVKLFGIENATEYSEFLKVSNILRRRLNIADRLSRISNHIIRFFIPDADSTIMFY